MTNPRAQLHARLKELLSQCEWDALDKQPNDNAVLRHRAFERRTLSHPFGAGMSSRELSPRAQLHARLNELLSHREVVCAGQEAEQ